MLDALEEEGIFCFFLGEIFFQLKSLNKLDWNEGLFLTLPPGANLCPWLILLGWLIWELFFPEKNFKNKNLTWKMEMMASVG